ncbi:MAG: methionyl-tRNA formyltransferase [Lachnospiraceae bacterium]|nr:methionyl-tRNA formyltransferase [Lachnospiraceae bacterium]
MIKNVVFMGTPDFATGTLKALIASDRYQVQAVFSQPDKPKGRGKTLQMMPVKAVAVEAGIPVYQPVKIRQPEWIEELRKLRPDVIVVVAFGQIIPREILDIPEYGCINVHASLLPKYRGAAPVQWAVINGERESGVTTMRMDAGLDTGDMIMRTTVPLTKDETGGSLFEKLSAAGAQLLLETLDALGEGTAVFEKQPAISPTPYAAMLKKEDGRIDWKKSACAIECLIRGTDPWPGAWTHFHGKLLKIWKAEAIMKEEEKEKAAEAPGVVCGVSRSGLYVQTGNGVISILELQPEGKKRMPVDAFLRGYPVQIGEQM